MSVPGALDASGVSLILVDAACTDHLFSSCSRPFARSRPHLRLVVIGLEENHDYIQQVIGAGAKGHLQRIRRARTRSGWRSRLCGMGRCGRRARYWLGCWMPPTAERRECKASEPKFTERENQVLQLLVAGRAEPGDCEALGIDRSNGEGARGAADEKDGWGITALR